ncbi:hypothetical protein G9A89_009851 [Geosiphon pyriformis]|nr:hypothetical protein G9A89_009851 [Geosiphon pyriformis]
MTTFGEVDSNEALSDVENHLPTNYSYRYAKNRRRKTHIDASTFNIRFTTSHLNTFFQSLAFRAPHFFKIWFGFGVIVAIAVMVIGIGFMIFAAREILIALFNPSSQEIQEIVSKVLQKRTIGDEFSGPNLSSTHLHHFTTLLIPGLTIPLSHTLYFLFALLVCGIFHEAGHAIAASNESVLIKNTGVFLYILYPGAFVNLDMERLVSLPCVRQLRILCAGVWHNAVLYIIGVLLMSMGVVQVVLGSTFWKSVDGWGVNVISIEKDSPLFLHLHRSSLITRLDDYPLSESSLNQWNKFLIDPDKIVVDGSDWKGFCSSADYAASSMECCDVSDKYPFGKSHNESLSCFKHLGENIDEQYTCLPSVSTVRNDAHRCSSDTDCVDLPGINTTRHNCVIPYTPIPSTKLLRIYYQEPPWVSEVKQQQDDDTFEEKMVLLFGKLDEMLEMIQVSDLQPRWSFIPGSIPVICELLLSYTTSVSLGLCILNMMPAFYLDGYYALSALLILIFRLDKNREEAMIYGAAFKNRRKALKVGLQQGIALLLTFIVAWVIIGAFIIALRQI